MNRISYYSEILQKLHPLQATPKIFNYLKYRLLKRKATVSCRQYTPQIASLILTMRCNLNCAYCNIAKVLRENRKNCQEYEASLERVKRIFNHPLFVNCLVVDLLGGEPLLVKDLDRIVGYLTQRGYITNISTNGLLLANRINDLKRAGISRINVSLYETNQPIIKRNITKINRIFPVHTSFVLQRSMIEKEADKILEMARNIHNSGCLSLRFWMYRPMGLKPQLDEIIDDSNPAYIEFRQRMENILPKFCFWPVEVKTKKIKKMCPQLWQRINCDMLGNIGICCGTDEFLQGKNSNLFDGEPDMIFNHPALVNLRKQLLDPESDPPTICKKCNLLGDPGW